MVQYINKAAWQDALLKEEIMDEISDGGIPVEVTWDDVTEKPAVIAAGATQADARTAIGAGTSNLAIGTTASTAAAGNHTHVATAVTVAADATNGITAGNLQVTLSALAARIVALETAAA